MVDHADHFRGRRLAGCVRVSAASQCVDAQRGIAAQMEAVKRYAGEAGPGVVWYVDEGSGDAPPALKALLAGAGSPDRDFDAVVVCSWSRLSRSFVGFQRVRSELPESGVAVVSVSESVTEE